MQEQQLVRITYNEAQDTYKRAITYRAIFEYYGHRVSLHDLREEDRIRAFFSEPTDAAITLVNAHGWGKTEEKAVINFDIIRRKNEIEFEDDEFHITPKNIAGIVRAGSGILIMQACHSGKQVFADAFLNAGYGFYIAPKSTSDCWSSLQFITTFIGYLMWEVRDWGKIVVPVPEAVERARKIDDFWDGANGFRLFSREKTQ